MMVELLDGGEERVEVKQADGLARPVERIALSRGIEHMFIIHASAPNTQKIAVVGACSWAFMS